MTVSKKNQNSTASVIPDKVVKLSPLRNSSSANTVEELVAEQLAHFNLEPASEFGHSIAKVASQIYSYQGDVEELWCLTQKNISQLHHKDRIALFNAKKFLSFQLAKVLDTMQNPFRASYQTLE